MLDFVRPLSYPLITGTTMPSTKERSETISIKFPNYPSYSLNVPSQNLKTENLIFTLESIVYLFDRYFPDAANANLTVSLVPYEDAPICFRELNLIYLNTQTTSWAQAAYQFSHKLCHFMIPSKVKNELRWLE